MRVSYSDENSTGAAPPRVERSSTAPAERDPNAALARALMARLLPGTDAALLTTALLAEAAAVSSAGRSASGETSNPAVLELARVRHQLRLGAAARETQHDLNNPLTALLAEAQLLEMEARSEEHRGAARRIVELARRIVALTRRMDLPDPPAEG